MPTCPSRAARSTTRLATGFGLRTMAFASRPSSADGNSPPNPPTAAFPVRPGEGRRRPGCSRGTPRSPVPFRVSSQRGTPLNTLAQLCLEELTAGVAWQRPVGNHDVLGDLEVGRLLAAVREYLCTSTVAAPPNRTAPTFSPITSSGTAITAASATPGAVSSADSTSMLETFSPPRMMMSLIRSTMSTRPASSTRTMSPVCSHPSTIVSGFVSGRCQSPAVTFAPRTTSSPVLGSSSAGRSRGRRMGPSSQRSRRVRLRRRGAARS